MATLRLLLVAALLALPLWVVGSSPAHACSVLSVPLRDEVAGADIIATGTVGEMLVLPPESVAHPESLRAGSSPVEAKLEVGEYLKGSGPATQLVYQPAEEITSVDGAITSILTSRTDCGEAYKRGDRYVMFLKRFDSLRYAITFGTANISGTIPDGGDFRPAYLAPIRAEVASQAGLPPTGSGPPHHGPPISPLIAASALAGLGLAANTAFALRRRG